MVEYNRSNEADESLRKLALKMLKENIDIKIISQSTGLSVNEISKIKASN